MLPASQHCDHKTIKTQPYQTLSKFITLNFKNIKSSLLVRFAVILSGQLRKIFLRNRRFHFCDNPSNPPGHPVVIKCRSFKKVKDNDKMARGWAAQLRCSQLIRPEKASIKYNACNQTVLPTEELGTRSSCTMLQQLFYLANIVGSNASPAARAKISLKRSETVCRCAGVIGCSCSWCTTCGFASCTNSAVLCSTKRQSPWNLNTLCFLWLTLWRSRPGSRRLEFKASLFG